MELESKQITLTAAHHGTYVKNIASIIVNNFWESEDHNQWFGDGAYFFVPGLADPKVSAMQYAIDTARKENVTDPVCVLEATILVNNDSFLDLTQIDGLQLFNSYRDEILSKISLIGKKPSIPIDDHDLMKNLRKELEIELVKGNVYIMFGIQRIGHFKSRIPNVTIFVVNNPVKNIDLTSIKRIA